MGLLSGLGRRARGYLASASDDAFEQMRANNRYSSFGPMQEALAPITGWRGGVQGWQLAAAKEEAAKYVANNPRALQAVEAAQSEQEIAQIVDSVITRSRSRMTEGGF